jgi:hypothetical protein
MSVDPFFERDEPREPIHPMKKAFCIVVFGGHVIALLVLIFLAVTGRYHADTTIEPSEDIGWRAH